MSFANAAFRRLASAAALRPVRAAAVLFGAALATTVFSTATQNANANGETRSLTMHHAHTNELITITFKRDGSFDSGALEKLNWFLRDWRVDEPISMAPQLFDILWFVYREVGASEPIKVMSAYRSPGTNAMLRRRSRAVAKESQHMRGNAMDIHIPGVSMARVREIGMRLQRGGVGYYPGAGSPFVHLDVGSVRSWPRMPRDQLERLFPDGKTVHLPADGIPLANYQSALAEVQARGGSALDYATVTSNRGKSLWALLFGGDEDEDIARDVGRGGGRNARTASRGRTAPAEQVAAYSGGDTPSAWGAAAIATAPPVAVQRAPAPVQPAPRRDEVAEPAVAPAPAAPAPETARAPLQVASLPIPPIRPRGAQFASLVASTEPLPPIRPTGLGLIAQATPAPPAAGPAAPEPVALAAIANMPLPPLRPAATAAAVSPETAPVAPAPVVVANVPMPPLRPAMPSAESPPPAAPAAAVAALPGIVSRAPETGPASGLSNAYAAVPAPVPPSRPPMAPGAAPRELPRPAALATAPVPQAAPVPARLRDARPAFVPRPTNPMAMVAEQPAALARPAQVNQVAEPPVDREVRSAVTASRFSQGGGQVAAGGFSGSFIRPIGMSFSRSGE